MKLKTKPATVGDKISQWYSGWTTNSDPETTSPDPYLARRIDVAVRRAVKEGFNTGRQYTIQIEQCRDQQAFDIASELERKYNVKL